MGKMGFFEWLKKLYSLDTLDTRFTISSRTPPRQAAIELQLDPVRPSPAEAGLTSKSRQNGRPSRTDDLRPPLWGTPEFYFYYFVFLTAVPMMFKVSFDVSRRKSKDAVYVELCTNIMQPRTQVIQSTKICFPVAGYPAGKLYVSPSRVRQASSNC